MNSFVRKMVTAVLLILALSSLQGALAAEYSPVEVSGSRAQLRFDRAVRERKTMFSYSEWYPGVDIVIVEPGSLTEVGSVIDGTAEDCVLGQLHTQIGTGYSPNVYKDGQIVGPRPYTRLASGQADAWFEGQAESAVFVVTLEEVRNPASPYDGKLVIVPGKAGEAVPKVDLFFREDPVSDYEEPEAKDLPLAFADVPEDAPYRDAVAWAVRQGITMGTSETTFSPESTCTRGQVVTFLWRMAGQPEGLRAVNQGLVPFAVGRSFSDVGAESYCGTSVLWAIERKVTNGTTDTTFSPNALCTYGHILTFLWRFMGSPTPQGDGGIEPGLYEGTYYREALLWAQEQGLAEHLASFPVNAPCPRGEVVRYLYLIRPLSLEQCIARYRDESLSAGNGGKATVTMEHVKAASLMPWKEWNEGPETSSRTLNPNKEQLSRLVWAVWLETPYTVGGLPHGDSLRNVRIQAVFDARTGAVLESGYSGGNTAAERSS